MSIKDYLLFCLKEDLRPGFFSSMQKYANSIGYKPKYKGVNVL